ncbi:MAG: GNAT family N-acetyltransferase [Bacteroidota bacterium]
MNSKIKIDKLDPNDKVSICRIADWYFKEWDTPIEKTIKRLSNQSKDDIIFQAILTIDEELIATGGLCINVNIYNQYPELKAFKPWIGLLYTRVEFRNRGFGQRLLEFIEQYAKDINLNKIYLYTFTAQSFYETNGWTVMKSVEYKDHNTYVMEKEI